MRFIGVDPSMSNTAIVCGEVINDEIKLISYKITHTEKSKVKGTPVMQDRLNRIKELFATIDEVLEDFKPDICIAEFPTGSQSSQASVGVGISLSILAKLPNLIGVTALDVKKIVGVGVVSKDKIMDYCDNKYKDFNFERKKDGTLVKARMEHLCDAIVVVEAGLKKLKQTK